MEQSAQSAGRILVVDDSDITLDMCSAILEDAGFDVITRADTHELADFVRSFAPDVVLLDVTMPGLGDSDLGAAVQSCREAGAGSVLLHSTRSEQELADMARQSGADGFVVKSGNDDAFELTVREWVVQARGDGAKHP